MNFTQISPINTIAAERSRNNTIADISVDNT